MNEKSYDLDMQRMILYENSGIGQLLKLRSPVPARKNLPKKVTITSTPEHHANTRSAAGKFE